MNTLLRNALALAGMAIAAQASAQVNLYEGEGFAGRSFNTERQVVNLERQGFNDRASSAVVAGERWEVCEDAGFRGRCVILRPGNYPSLAAMGLDNRVSSVRGVSRRVRVDDSRYAPLPVAPEVARITLYEREGFAGLSFSSEEQIANFQRHGFNDRASSVVVVGERWEVCEDAAFRGRCVVLRPGQYANLAAMGLDNQVSSVRNVSPRQRIDDSRYAPLAGAPHDYRRRGNEPLYEATVTSVRAVVGPPEQRCWVEREQVQAENRTNVPGAIAGAVIGGILGHQVGSGRGQDIVTVGGAAAGAAIGSRVGAGETATSRDVQRCTTEHSQAAPKFWDVSYSFRGQEHRLQMSSPPGATVTVDARGEPRA
jgi:uncharacterized protein YcfJ